ncbi:quinone-dependent dihydroorotate dehydrogenase [soil metagenome]
MIADALYQLAKPALFRHDPETGHDRAISLLAFASRHAIPLRLLQAVAPHWDARFSTPVFGLTFPFPLGIAAGFDKNAVAFPALLTLGFGHVEAGTVTPRPQPGNDRPRVFRLIEDQALINRMGFPGHGVAAAVNTLATPKRSGMIIGCNIGPNKVSVEVGAAVEDLVAGYRAVAASASYVAINISSPNTYQLRDLQQPPALRTLLAAVNAERAGLQWRPLLLKISPDMNDRELLDLLDVAIESRIDGIIATNTTITRPPTLLSQNRPEGGGLSGAPLSFISARIVRRIANETRGTLPIIAAGGIQTGADVVAALSAGATLAQTYTGFIYRGPAMARMIAREIDQELARLGMGSLEEVRAGRRYAQ